MERSRDSSVVIVMGYGFDGPGSILVMASFLFSTESRPPLGPTHPPIQNGTEREGDFTGGNGAVAWSWLLISI
jgi:hypothetical protein